MFKCVIYKLEGNNRKSVKTIYGCDKNVLKKIGTVTKQLYTVYSKELGRVIKSARNVKYWYEISPCRENDKVESINTLDDITASVVIYVDLKKGDSNIEYFNLVSKSVVDTYELDKRFEVSNFMQDSFEVCFYAELDSKYIKYAVDLNERAKLMKEIKIFGALNLTEDEMLNCIKCVMDS